MALLLCVFGWFVLAYHFFPRGQMSWFTDTWFHLMRIRDLNMSFGHMTIPNVVNNQTFLNVGQAFNAMYPTYSLWPFVLLTSWLNPIEQWWAMTMGLIFVAVLSCIYGLNQLKARFSTNFILGFLLVLSNATIVYIHTGSTGMLIGAIMLPAIFVNLYVTIKHQSLSAAILLTVLLAIVIGSHLLSGLLDIVMVGIFLFINVVVRKSKKSFAALFGVESFSLILSAPAWIMPIVFMLAQQIQPVTQLALVGSNPHELLISIFQPLETLQLMSFGVFMAAPILAVILAVNFIHPSHPASKSTAWILPFYLGAAVLLFIMCTSIFPWRIFPQWLGSVIQGPLWRLMPLSTALIMSTVAILFAEAEKISPLQRGALLSLIIICQLLSPGSQILAWKRQVPQLPLFTNFKMENAEQKTMISNSVIHSSAFQNYRIYSDYMPTSQYFKKHWSAAAAVWSHQTILANGQAIPTLIRDATPTQITFEFTTPVQGIIDLPYWSYRPVRYSAGTNHVTTSKRDTVEVEIKKNQRSITVTAHHPWQYLAALGVAMVGWVALLAGGWCFWQRKKHQSSQTTN